MMISTIFRVKFSWAIRRSIRRSEYFRFPLSQNFNRRREIASAITGTVMNDVHSILESNGDKKVRDLMSAMLRTSVDAVELAFKGLLVNLSTAVAEVGAAMKPVPEYNTTTEVF